MSTLKCPHCGNDIFKIKQFINFRDTNEVLFRLQCLECMNTFEVNGQDMLDMFLNGCSKQENSNKIKNKYCHNCKWWGAPRGAGDYGSRGVCTNPNMIDLSETDYKSKLYSNDMIFYYCPNILPEGTNKLDIDIFTDAKFYCKHWTPVDEKN